ncbi:MAG: VTT domain-containing protein, partial [Elusimicrobia bacterium]|nr:VTT domain-containing protein [Elusimicrobiota bacterium]
MNPVLDWFVHFVSAMQGNPWSPVAFISVYTSACFAFPISLFPITGGILFGFWGGLACNYTAEMLGASGAFLLAKKMRWAFLHRFIQRHQAKMGTTFVQRHGFGTLLMIRLIGF